MQNPLLAGDSSPFRDCKQARRNRNWATIGFIDRLVTESDQSRIGRRHQSFQRVFSNTRQGHGDRDLKTLLPFLVIRIPDSFSADNRSDDFHVADFDWVNGEDVVTE